MVGTQKDTLVNRNLGLALTRLRLVASAHHGDPTRDSATHVLTACQQGHGSRTTDVRIFGTHNRPLSFCEGVSTHSRFETGCPCKSNRFQHNTISITISRIPLVCSTLVSGLLFCLWVPRQRSELGVSPHCRFPLL